MARRTRRPFLPAPRTVLVPPREECWIESDAYDRSAFATLLVTTVPLAQLAEDGESLVPHFPALLEDLFCLLFKLTPRRRAASEVAPSAALGGRLLAWLTGQPPLEALRQQTRLDETQSGLGTVLLGEELLQLVRAEQLLPRGDLRDLWDLQRQEEELRARALELDHLAAIKASQATRDAIGNAARVAEARLRQKAQQLDQRLGEVPLDTTRRLGVTAALVAPELERAADDAQAWSTGLGSGGRLSPGRQIELGRRLVRNRKLRRLAEVVGRMRPHALALRKRAFERTNEERYALEPVRDLEHLLPTELVALGHPLLRRDFARRLLEGQVLGYQLRGVENKGHGPMIVCVDGSSSMEGEKEIWAKAVALTLLEIARRQRRLFRFISFAGPDTPLVTIDLNPRDHHAVRVDRALEVAEVFPGGGTDFQQPLDAAVACLGQVRYRRGDVVLITDGECRVEATWAARFGAEKRRLGFSLFSILIDVGASARETLTALSDRVVSIRELTNDAASDLFTSL